MIQLKFLGTMPAAQRPLMPRPPAKRRAAWTVAATSWTRSTAAPHAIAHTAEASEPSKRSSTPRTGPSPTRPSGDPPAARWPRKPLRLVPTSTGTPSRHELGERRHELEIVADRLAEPDARIDVDLRHAGGSGRRRRGLEELPDLPDDVGVPRVELHARRDRPCGASRRTRLRARLRRAPGWLRRRSTTSPRRGRAARATSDFVVSIETRTSPASASTTGTTRRSSSSTATGSAPGRVDSPPTSTTSAPSATISRPRRTAAS